MKKRWWQFGGWFSVDPVGDRKRAWIRRAKIHLRRIAGDGLKTLLILILISIVLYFISLPFWPLAVPPVPQEWLERYPPVEFEPRGDGAAERALQAMYPWPPDALEPPPELADAPLHQLMEKLESARNEEYFLDWTSPPLLDLLAKVEEEFLAFAELCAVEDPPDTDYQRMPQPPTKALRPVIRWSGLSSGINVLNDNPDQVLHTMSRGLTMSAYFTRSDRLFEWLVGNMLMEIELRSVVSMYIHGMMDTQLAREVQTTLVGWQRARGNVSRAMQGELQYADATIDYVYGRSIDTSAWNTYAESAFDLHFRERMWKLRRWGWFWGNGYHSVRQAAWNQGERNVLLARIWTDAAVSDPGRVSAGLEYCRQIWFRRGGFIHAFENMDIFFESYFRRLYQADAQQIIAHAMAALGAYRYEHGHLPESLTDAYIAAGLQVGLQTTYVDQVPLYQHWSGGHMNPEAYVLTLTIRGDGGRCAREGGVSWLLVHNPAFDEEPAYRFWQWYNMNPAPKTALDPDILELELVETMAGRLSPGPRVLQVPADIMSKNAEKLALANNALREAGWTEIAIPPRLWVRH